VGNRAVAAGDNCIDNYVCPVRRKFVGGNALNVAVAMRRCDISVSYVGAVGTDEEGHWMLESLRAEGIDVSHVQILPGSSAVTDVELRDHDRVFLREELGVTKDFRLDRATLEFIAEHELVHNSCLGQTVPYLRDFKNAGLVVSFDYSNMYDQELFSETLRFVDIAFVSTPGGDSSAAEELIKKIIKKGPRVVAATMGAAGSLVSDGARLWRQDASPVDQVEDTLGAGDAFIGAFLAGWLRGRPTEETLRLASLRAAETCRHLGAWVPQLRSGECLAE